VKTDGLLDGETFLNKFVFVQVDSNPKHFWDKNDGENRYHLNANFKSYTVFPHIVIISLLWKSKGHSTYSKGHSI
jgi:hypothetical protein